MDFMAKEKAKEKSTKTKKTTPPKKRKKRKLTKAQKKRRLKKILKVSAAILALLLSFAYGYYLGFHKANQTQTPFMREEDYCTDTLLKDLKTIKQKRETNLKKQAIKSHDSHQEKKPRKKPLPKHVVAKPIQKYDAKMKEKKPKSQPVVSGERSNKPKLVIVIDDVSTSKQLHSILSTKMAITPSIFPPYALAPHSNRLAKGLKHYMVHLPMESGSKQFNTQSKTLMTSFSVAQMRTRAKELRRLFPHALYVNNHTGSVFTSNYIAMYRLYKVLKSEGFLFLDSRTIASSKVRDIAKRFGDRYLGRDIFIDNVHTTKAIHAQLRKAVKLAKRRGYAIVIGHPHRLTIESIASAKYILKDVELLYIDEFYKMKRK